MSLCELSNETCWTTRSKSIKSPCLHTVSVKMFLRGKDGSRPLTVSLNLGLQETTLTGWHLAGEAGGRVWPVHRDTPPHLSVRHSDVVSDLGSSYYWDAPEPYLGNKVRHTRSHTLTHTRTHKLLTNINCIKKHSANWSRFFFIAFVSISGYPALILMGHDEDSKWTQTYF